jgi:hypothetical protein
VFRPVGGGLVVVDAYNRPVGMIPPQMINRATGQPLDPNAAWLPYDPNAPWLLNGYR